MALEKLSAAVLFGGEQIQFRHYAESVACPMRCSVFLPPQAKQGGGGVAALYWLSGLTCTDENFTQKAGAQRYAAEAGIALVAPDTSPRGAEVADDDSWDFGQGAGFYVSATRPPWQKNFQMEKYILQELPDFIEQNFPVSGRRAISGHSMGGHGALTLALKNPARYCSVSAFAPICSPANCPWGQKALRGYLGDDKNKWRQYDACALVADGAADGAADKLELLVEQGTADEFLHTQLKPELLQDACQKANHPLALKMRDGYDHSYYFIATFIGEHIAYHARRLNGAG